jgi:hypothetical protein
MICFMLALGLSPAVAAAREPSSAADPQTQREAVQPAWNTYQEIPDTFELVAENTLFQLHANPETLAFKVVDKRSGYIWHSNLDEKGEDDRLNKTWTAFAQSGISIDYLDAKAITERNSITNAEHTLDYQQTDQGFHATVKFTDPSISLDVKVQLEESGVSVEIPFESIKEESPDFKLGLLYVYPFFAATREDAVPGYMLIPDGSGSLIRFSSTTKATNIFYGRYYGTDLGMISEMPFDPTQNREIRISIPVIGMVHDEGVNAYIAIVEKGASYGEINAHPAGVVTNFNFLYNAFFYNQSYFQATNRSGAGVTTLQPNTNAFDVKIQYRFLTGADSDYVGMARSYQQYLVDQGQLNKITTQNEDIGIRLEFLGGDKEKVLFWYRFKPMTTVPQMKRILENLDIHNPDVIYYGWQPLGALAMPPKNLKLAHQLGSLGGLRSLSDEIVDRGGNFYLYVDPQAAVYGEKGFSSRYDLAMSITNLNLIGYNRMRANYYLNLNALSERYSGLSEDVLTQVNGGLAVDGLGSMLYSDFKKNNHLNRDEAIEAYQQLLADWKVKTSFYLPNDYVFGFMQAYYDIPIANNGYIYTTDEVPFLQIVLAGYVPYYGPALNFSSNLQTDLLRLADYGVYPSFFLTQEPTSEILQTASNWIYTSSYDQWSEEVQQTYQWLNSLLGPVTGESIIAREVLTDGVVATTYSNGKQVIVNYNDQPYSEGSVTVNARDAVLVEVAP